MTYEINKPPDDKKEIKEAMVSIITSLLSEGMHTIGFDYRSEKNPKDNIYSIMFCKNPKKNNEDKLYIDFGMMFNESSCYYLISIYINNKHIGITDPMNRKEFIQAFQSFLISCKDLTEKQMIQVIKNTDLFTKE